MAEKVSDTNVIRSTISGALSGATSVCLLHPIDLVKIRYQGIYTLILFIFSSAYLIMETVGRCKGVGYLKSLKLLYKQEGGIRGLYRGVTVGVTASTLAWGTFFFW